MWKLRTIGLAWRPTLAACLGILLLAGGCGKKSQVKKQAAPPGFQQAPAAEATGTTPTAVDGKAVADAESPEAPAQAARRPEPLFPEFPWIPRHCRLVRDVNRDGLVAAICHHGFEGRAKSLADGSKVAFIAEGESVMLMGNPTRADEPDRAVARGADLEAGRFRYRGFVRFCVPSRKRCHRVGEVFPLAEDSEAKIAGFAISCESPESSNESTVTKVEAELADGRMVDIDTLTVRATAAP